MAFTWTDPSLSTSYQIRAVHFNEMRAAVDTIRSFFGMGGYSWDPSGSLVPGAHPVRATHLNQVRIAAEAWAPGQVWPQQAGVNTASGRVNESIEPRYVHVTSLRAVLDSVHTQVTSWHMDSAYISGDYGYLVGSGVFLILYFSTYNSTYFPGPIVWHCVSSNPSVAPSFNYSQSLSNGATSTVIGGTVNFAAAGSVYYTVTVQNYPSVPGVNSNSITAVNPLTVTYMYIGTTDDLNTFVVGQVAQLMAHCNRTSTGEYVTISSSLGGSSGFNPFRANGGSAQVYIPNGQTVNNGGSFNITAVVPSTENLVSGAYSKGPLTISPPNVINIASTPLYYKEYASGQYAISGISTGFNTSTMAPLHISLAASSSTRIIPVAKIMVVDVTTGVTVKTLWTPFMAYYDGPYWNMPRARNNAWEVAQVPEQNGIHVLDASYMAIRTFGQYAWDEGVGGAHSGQREHAYMSFPPYFAPNTTTPVFICTRAPITSGNQIGGMWSGVPGHEFFLWIETVGVDASSPGIWSRLSNTFWNWPAGQPRFTISMLKDVNQGMDGPSSEEFSNSMVENTFTPLG